MTWEQVVILAICALGGSGLVLWFMKREFSRQGETIDKIHNRMSCFETSQHACQLENVRTFVTKSEFSELERTVISHDRRIITIEAREAKQ